MAQNTQSFRLFNDPVHGHIQLNKECQLIVDTEEFQRLRDIKQLGVVDFVYPGATHTRFQHALGTYHMAGKFVRRLEQTYPEFKLDPKDILCVEIAGLCHDLGCGPLSTLFSKRFLPKFEKTNNKKLTKRNALMFQLMWENNKLQEKLQFKDKDIKFIKELIDGYDTTGSTKWPYEGRTEDYAYLYEIVQNHRNGIDVCKFDYMARDCQNLGIPNNFDAHRYMEFARVIEVDGERQICTRNKEVENLYNMFFTRYNLHKNAYQHKVVCGIELLIVDILEAIKDEPLIKTKSGNWKSLSEILHTLMEASNKPMHENLKDVHVDCITGYSRLNDGFMYYVRHYKTMTGNEITKVEKLLERLYTRDMYKCVFESPPVTKCKTEAEIKKKVFDAWNDDSKEENDIQIMIIELDFGMKDENPMNRLREYTKRDMEQAFKRDQSQTKDILKTKTIPPTSRLLDGMNYKEYRIRIFATFFTKGNENQERLKSLKSLCEKKFDEKEFTTEKTNN